MNTQEMSLLQIRNAGLKALARELGPVGMVRFLQQYDTGKADYTRDRHEWLDQLDSQTAAREIIARRKKSDPKGSIANP